MKISSPTDNVRYLSQIRGKKDGDASGQQKHHQDQPKKDQESFDEALEVSQQKLEEAVEGFSKDAQAQQNGLSVATSGDGPGLRVTLKDGSGSVVRQFTGEEFLRLRIAATGSSTSKDGPARGKLLDRKL